MSKRYGRNQKRKARVEIANLRAAVEQREALLQRQRTDIDDLKSTILAVQYALGSNTALLPPQNLPTCNRFPPRDFQTEVPMKLNLVEYVMMGSVEPVKQITHTMRMLLSNVKHDPLYAKTHCYVTLESNRTAYAISDEALHGMDRDLLRHMLVTQVSREMAENMMDQILGRLRMKSISNSKAPESQTTNALQPPPSSSVCPAHSDGQHIEDWGGSCMGEGCTFRFSAAPAEQPDTAYAADAWAEGFRAGASWRMSVEEFWEKHDYGESPKEPSNPYRASGQA